MKLARVRQCFSYSSKINSISYKDNNMGVLAAALRLDPNKESLSQLMKDKLS